MKNQIGMSDNNSALSWICFTILTGFFLISPFYTGLFNGYSPQFDRPILTSIAWCSCSLVLISSHYFKVWKINTANDFFPLLIWLFPLIYLISSLQAASSHLSYRMTVINSLFAIFFILAYHFAKNKLTFNMMQLLILIPGYFVVIFGFLNLFGQSHYRDAVMITGEGIRLTSVFQYANGYAGYLVALLFANLYVSVVTKQRYILLMNSLITVPIVISFIMTLSRGAIVILPVVLICVIVFLNYIRQLELIIGLIFATLISFLIIDNLTSFSQELLANNKQNLANAWVILIGVSVLYSLLSLGIRVALLKISSRTLFMNKLRYKRIILPISLVIIGVGALFLLRTDFINILPSQLKERIQSINFEQHSVIERETWYKDSLELYKDYPILGTGGGGWATLFERYQDSPYITNQVHNFFLQTLVETGLIGFVILMLLIAAIFSLFVKQFLVDKDKIESSLFFYIFCVALLVHSTLDFEMSYVYIGAIFFFCLGAVASQGHLIKVKWKQPTWVNKIFPAVMLVISLVLFVNSYRDLQANSYFRDSLTMLNQGKGLNEAMPLLNKSIELDKGNYYFTLTKIDLLSQVYSQSKDNSYFDEAIKQIRNLEKKEPFNRALSEHNINLHLLKEDYNTALSLAKNNLESYKWNLYDYDQAIFINFQLGNKEVQEKQGNKGTKYWDEALQLYNTILSKKNELDRLPPGLLKDKPFEITARTRLIVGEIYYLRGDFLTSSNVLKGGIGDLKDPANRAIARWYLAALRKQNSNDPELAQKLFSIDLKEQDYVQELLNLM